ncbi:hypothetical protein FC777_02270 [Clostridium botulinum]|nr:hypothetical protein [Clostridium botulinum]
MILESYYRNVFSSLFASGVTLSSNEQKVNTREKMAKCIQELERIKGIRKGGNGNNQYMLREDNPPLAKQEQLASELGISQKYLQEMKKLTTLIPELQTMIENGSMKATVGYKIWRRI